MATARRREQRLAIVYQAGLVWSMFGGELEEWQIAEYIRCGQLPEVIAGMPSLPGVEEYMAKIQAVGKFVMPDSPVVAVRVSKRPAEK